MSSAKTMSLCPSISVVIPIHNGERFVKGCVESVLGQTYPAMEIIGVNDGSTDDTAKELARFAGRIRVITQPNRGRSAARNRGIEAASGDYVAFLDVDDRYLPHHLEQLVEGVNHERQAADIVYSWVGAPYCPEGRRVPRKPQGRHAWKHIIKNQLWVVTSMVSASFLRRSGIRFEEGLEIGEDALFFWRLILLGARVRYVRKRGVTIGIHDANTTSDPRQRAASLRARDIFDEHVKTSPARLAGKMRKHSKTGRNHAILMRKLAFIYMGPSETETGWNAPELLRAAYARRLLVSDRARAVLAAVWVAFPRVRFPQFTRMVFGYQLWERVRQSCALK